MARLTPRRSPLGDGLDNNNASSWSHVVVLPRDPLTSPRESTCHPIFALHVPSIHTRETMLTE